MAGDWIKVEHATLDKPEVYAIAEHLGVTPEHALGLLIKFWVWLDRNSRNGDVTLASRSSIDSITHTPGFSALLELVGWAKFSDADGKMTISNFDRHNGKPAKTRALGRERQSRSRHAFVTQDALPEKRREENKTTTARKPVDNSGAVVNVTHSLASKLKTNGKGQWWRTADGIAAKGKALGIPAKPGEGLMDYKARLFKAGQ